VLTCATAVSTTVVQYIEHSRSTKHAASNLQTDGFCYICRAFIYTVCCIYMLYVHWSARNAALRCSSSVKSLIQRLLVAASNMILLYHHYLCYLPQAASLSRYFNSNCGGAAARYSEALLLLLLRTVVTTLTTALLLAAVVTLCFYVYYVDLLPKPASSLDDTLSISSCGLSTLSLFASHTQPFIICIHKTWPRYNAHQQ
jgi:hypothetical protein